VARNRAGTARYRIPGSRADLMARSKDSRCRGKPCTWHSSDPSSRDAPGQLFEGTSQSPETFLEVEMSQSLDRDHGNPGPGARDPMPCQTPFRSGQRFCDKATPRARGQLGWRERVPTQNAFSLPGLPSQTPLAPYLGMGGEWPLSITRVGYPPPCQPL
jgi:hypothetical protein